VFDLTVLIRSFAKEAPEMYVFDKDKTEETLLTAISSPSYEVFVSEEDDQEISGLLLAVYVEPLLTRTKVATELAWFVSKEFRTGKQALGLLKAFESWAESLGADYVIMSDIKGVGDLSSLYERKGYTLEEASYSKRIK